MSPTGLESPEPRWASPPLADPAAIAGLMDVLHLPETVCSLLAGRGFEDPEDAKRFLRPRIDHLHDPTLLTDGSRAAERLARASERGETVLVHGDYDVDGVCGAALYTRWLRGLGIDVVPFVPHRIRHGYDFGEAGLDAARRAGATLILTADCGISAHEPVHAAREEGIDVIVTDHHSVGPELPPALAVVDPQRDDCAYPDKGLCGTGVAFKVCELVGRLLGADVAALHAYLDLVALATVADLVPLQGENRVLVRHGLRAFSSTRVLGLAALLGACGVEAGAVRAGRIGFVVAPRINAAGRIGDSAEALRLLLTEDRREAVDLAGRLDDLNRRRQEEDCRTLDEALEILERHFDPHRDFGVVLAAEGWHPGVIGIVASRVVERIHRPTVLLAVDGAQARGSARSIPGFHLYEAVAACSSHLRRFGGHRQAAGMDIDTAQIPDFRTAFNDEARRRLATDELRPVLRLDAELPLAAADLQLVHWLEYLGPHGIGNPRPVFMARGVRLHRPRVVGERHLKVGLSHGTGALDGIGFGLAGRHPPEALDPRKSYDVLFKLERNEWRGEAKVQARIVDLRTSTDGTGGVR